MMIRTVSYSYFVPGNNSYRTQFLHAWGSQWRYSVNNRYTSAMLGVHHVAAV